MNTLSVLHMKSWYESLEQKTKTGAGSGTMNFVGSFIISSLRIDKNVDLSEKSHGTGGGSLTKPLPQICSKSLFGRAAE